MSVEKSMEHYTLYFKDVCLGALTVDSLSGEYAFEPDTAGVQLAREETVLIREVEFRAADPLFFRSASVI